MSYNSNNDCSGKFPSIFSADSINKLDHPQLMLELNKRGLVTTGTIPELSTRLFQYLNGEALQKDFTEFV